MPCDLEVIRLRNNSSAILVMSSDQHYSDVIMCTMAAPIIGASIMYSAVCSGTWKKTSKLRVTGICEGNSPVPGEFPALRATNTENAFIWWRHHDKMYSKPLYGKKLWKTYIEFRGLLLHISHSPHLLIALPCWAHWWSHKCTTAVSEAWVLAIYVSS